ncbi:MAG: peroxiredoxin-like family protein [Puniceicoccaceae bacterium]
MNPIRNTACLISLRLLAICLCIGGTSTTLHGAANTPQTITPLFEGLSVPDSVTVFDTDGTAVDLSEQLRTKPTVLVFYRGGWCPYCNQHLSDLAGIETELQSLGYQIIALSPDSAESLQAHLNKSDVGYTLLSDHERNASDAFGLTFKVDASTHEMLLGYGIDIEKAAGNSSRELPVPGVFLIREGRIHLAYVNPDYTIRLSGEVLLAAARVAAKKE